MAVLRSLGYRVIPGMAPVSRLLEETAKSCVSVVSVSACHKQHTGTIAGMIISVGESAKPINTLILNKQ